MHRIAFVCAVSLVAAALTGCSSGTPSKAEILKAWAADYSGSPLPKSDFQCRVIGVVPYQNGVDATTVVRRYKEHCTGAWEDAYFNVADFEMILLRDGTYRLADLRVDHENND